MQRRVPLAGAAKAQVIDWSAPASGEHAITVRAICADGSVQPAPTDPQIAGKHTYWESNGQITRHIRLS